VVPNRVASQTPLWGSAPLQNVGLNCLGVMLFGLGGVNGGEVEFRGLRDLTSL
jgi:hypothetical protein